MRGLVREVDGISRLFGAIAAALVIVLVVLMLYDVVLRYAFNAPTAWGNDLNTWLMGASFVLSIAYAMSTDSHVRVDLLYDQRTRPRIRYFDLVGLTLIILPTVGWVTPMSSASSRWLKPRWRRRVASLTPSKAPAGRLRPFSSRPR